MPLIELDSLDDPRVESYRTMRDPELVRRQGLFVAEGRLVVERLIAARNHLIESLLLSPAAFAAMRTSVESVSDRTPVFVCSVERFAQLTGVNIHRGCLALVQRPVARQFGAVIASARTVIVLEGVSNPDNVGGIFRNAAAFQADAVLLGPRCCDPYYRKAIRTSMGATLRVPFMCAVEWPETLRRLRAEGFTLAAMTPGRASVTLDVFSSAGRPGRLALLFGAEGEGLSDEAMQMADARVRIPVSADVDSLNVAVASGIALARLSPSVA